MKILFTTFLFLLSILSIFIYQIDAFKLSILTILISLSFATHSIIQKHKGKPNAYKNIFHQVGIFIVTLLLAILLGGLAGADPFNPNVAVEGMTKRIEQVLKFAENQSERNGVILDETDRFIIIALSQNGPGFDKNDVLIMYDKYIKKDRTINWKNYFEDKHKDWTETTWLKRVPLEAWQWIKTGETGKDFDTEFSLEMYYQEMQALESQGYPFPEGLDIQRIEDLMNTSEQARQEEQ
jgi:hypothetical protein